MKSADKAEEIEVKICGLTNLDDARAALDLGADFLGFVIYRKSPRGISETKMRHIVDRLPVHAQAVGVFVDMPKEMVLKIARECGLYAVQLHGRERPEEYHDVGPPVWRAVTFEDEGPVPDPYTWNARRYLVDVKKGGACQGSELTADWDRAAEFAKTWPTMLAGGLDVWNIETALRKVRPLGVDVSRGVERKPGKKDHRKMESFIRRAKETIID